MYRRERKMNKRYIAVQYINKISKGEQGQRGRLGRRQKDQRDRISISSIAKNANKNINDQADVIRDTDNGFHL